MNIIEVVGKAIIDKEKITLILELPKAEEEITPPVVSEPLPKRRTAGPRKEIIGSIRYQNSVHNIHKDTWETVQPLFDGRIVRKKRLLNELKKTRPHLGINSLCGILSDTLHFANDQGYKVERINREKYRITKKE